MKYKKELIITFFIAILILFLKYINVFQIENGLAKPSVLFLMVVIFSFFTIKIQRNIDISFKTHQLYYQNLNILKYISSILIIILHLRPFAHFSNELDLAFNNIVTRICVPIFFVITGYFVAKKEKENPCYIDLYIKKTIPLYLFWSLMYVPVMIASIVPYLSQINDYLGGLHISMLWSVVLIVLLLPVVVIVVLCYSGVYYHLWYFPAIILSLIVLKKWKKKFNIHSLLLISFLLLLFGATETYYGVLPISIKEVVSHYYHIFFTTRNFLFFGLFYVVLGYKISLKEHAYSNYCFLKLIISFFFLIFEAILLHDTKRLDSNILLSCIPVTYYLFVCTIYIQNKSHLSFSFGQYSKYYYLIHPMVIFGISLQFKRIYNQPFLYIIIVLLIRHMISKMIIELKKHVFW